MSNGLSCRRSLGIPKTGGDVARLCLAVSLLVAAVACGKSEPSAEALARRYAERVVESRDSISDQDELVHYFDASWTAVAWEMMAEQQLRAYRRGPRDGWKLFSVAGTMNLIEAADREARSVFFGRFCVRPPEKYFPPLVSDVSSIFEPGATFQQTLWPSRLREHGLIRVAQIEPHMAQCRERTKQEALLDRRIDELAGTHGLRRRDEHTFKVVKMEEILAVLARESPVNMRALPNTEELDILVQAGLAEVRVAGPEVEWALSRAGADALRRQPPLEVALDLMAKTASRFLVTGPPRRGRYVGVGRVVEAGVGILTGGDRWIAVEMLEGVSYWKTPYFAGDTIAAVMPQYDVQVDPTLKVGDLVGYREFQRPWHPDEWPESVSVWEKIPPSGTQPPSDAR